MASRHSGSPVVKVGPKGSFDDRFCSDPCVLRMGDVWGDVLLHAFDRRPRQRRASHSRGICSTGRSPAKVLIDVGPADSIDSRYAHKPGIISNGTRLHHFYCAVAPIDERPVGEFSAREMRGITSATGPIIV